MRKQLKRVAQVFTGTTPPTNEQKYYESEDIDWYSPGDIGTDSIYLEGSSKKISNLYLKEKKTKPFPRETILMVGIGATVGKVAYSDRPCYSNQQINAIIFNRKLVIPKFGAYQLLNMSKEINQKTPVVTLQIFNQNKVKQIELDIPTLAVQQRMVDYLDVKLSDISRQVSLLTRKRDAYLRLKKSIINHAVTKGLNPNAKMKDSGIEWIGDVPEEWKPCRFKDFVKLCTVTSNSIRKIGLENIESGTGRFIQTDTEFEGNGVEFKKSDIVYGKLRPYLQKVWMAEFSGNAIGDFFVFKTQKNALPSYIRYVMLSEQFTKEADSSTVGAKMPRVSSGFILSLQYCLPSLQEQRTIATYLDDKCGKIDTIVANLNKQISRYGDLKRSLIDEVITGKRTV